MRKFSIWSVLLLTVVSVGFWSLSSVVSAQDKETSGEGKSITSERQKDIELADLIKRLSNRSSEGLVETRLPNGGTSVDLQGRFQNVMLSKFDEYGEQASACVTSLGEANMFFGRDLETGEPLANYYYRKDPLAAIAAGHGMSVKEFKFYSDMISRVEKQMALNPNAATISILNADGVGEGFNDPTVVTMDGTNPGLTAGARRLNLFNHAAGIWGAFLDSNVTINVRAQFNPLAPCSPAGAVLGFAGPVNVHRNFTNAGFASTWYHAALANKQAGADLVLGTPEIDTEINSDIDTGCQGPGNRFYYGFDNATPALRINLLVVVLHELGHGLGFSSLVNGATGVLFGTPANPDAYTTFMFDQSTMLNWNAMTDAQRQASALNTNNVVWSGPNVSIASGFLTAGRNITNGRVQLFTPNPLQGGSSISHFSTAATPNLLMEPAINAGVAIDLDLTRQQMRDIGWYRDSNVDLTPDTITTVTPSGGAINIGTMATVNWTNNGGFNRSVIVELSTDGGATFPTVLGAGVPNFGGSLMTFNFTVPNMPTTQGRIRVREDNFVAPSAVSAANFIIQAPTAANVSVSGIVRSNQQSVSRAVVTLTDSQGNIRTSMTNNFGFFRFEDVEVGDNYVISVLAKGLQFAPQLLTVNEKIARLELNSL